jgi:hypothetical protein
MAADAVDAHASRSRQFPETEYHLDRIRNSRPMGGCCFPSGGDDFCETAAGSVRLKGDARQHRVAGGGTAKRLLIIV